MCKSPLVWFERVVSKFRYACADRIREKVGRLVCDRTRKNPYVLTLNGPGLRGGKAAQVCDLSKTCRKPGL
jgi:hypothetical protein